ncbi:TPA: imidazole glycerol phosphate synthase subunit HisH, partial [Klebsiella pneumoniae]|nr:imidazole glycerol phosphate synthase subunit HisH [Klebsiella pneumoniae]
NYGEAFTAAVQKDNFFGVQFHPERSGSAGAQLLKNFLEM